MFSFSRKAQLTPEELDRAACLQVDPDLFFPDKGGSTKGAKRVCLSCEIRQRCLEVALVNDERWGVYGGMSERERRKLKRRGYL